MTMNNEAFKKWYGKWCSYYGHYDVNKTAEVAWEMATTEANKRIEVLESEVAELHESDLAQKSKLITQNVNIAQLQANNHDLREALERCKKHGGLGVNAVVEEALSKTPAQYINDDVLIFTKDSLQAFENEVIER